MTFQARDPTPAELEARWIDMEADLYSPLLQAVAWREGHGGRNVPGVRGTPEALP